MNTGFEIEVSAVVDEASAKEAGKKLNTYVLNSLKDGYIKIPAAVEAEFKKDGKASKELREAHREFVDQWKKMSSVGFDSSSEELDDFIKKYNKFAKLMSKEGQYNTKQNNALKESGLGSLLRTYTNQVSAIEKQMAQLKKIDTTSHRQTKSDHKSKLSKEELDRYMKSKESYRPIPSKARTNVKVPEHVTETTLKETKYQGSYRSGFSRMNAVSMKEERSNELKSLKTKIVGVKKANEYAEKVLNEGKLYDSDVIRSRNKTSFSETEKSSKVSKVALKEAARLLSDIERNKKGEEGVEEHRALVQGSFALNQMSGKPVLDTTLDAVNSVIERYFKDAGNIELGGDEYAKGEGPGHELAKQVIKNTLDIVKKELTGVAGEDAEFQRQMRELAKIDPEAAIKQVSGLVTLSEDQNTILKQVLGQLKLNGNTTPSKESIDVNSVKTVAEKILTQNKVEAVSERVADDKEVKASRTLIDAAKSDASTGFNTDSKADLLISKQEKNSRILGKDVHETLNNILSKIGTKQEGDDASGLSQTSEMSLLQIISDNVQALRDGLVGKQTENKKSKSNSISFDTSSIEGFEKSLRDIMHIRSDRNLPAIVKKSLAEIKAPGPIAIPNPQRGLIPIKNTERTLDKGVTQGTNLWEYAEAKERNRRVEEDHITAATKANEEMLYEAATKSNEFKYGVRTPKVIELSGLTETVEKTFPDKLKSILGSFGDKLEKIFGYKRPSSANAAQILQMSEEERAKETAARLEKYGKTRGRDLSDTGAKSQYRYSQSLWSGDARVGRNSNLFQDIELTEGIGKVDTNSILSELQSAIEKNMFSAQTGGGFFKNLIGPAFGYLGMPSLEKSRAEVDGLNQVMADVREQVISILNEISGKEATLKAMEDQGQAVFNSEGKMVRGSAEAQNLFTDLENQKDTLRSALMEVQNIDAVVADCKGNVHEILQRLGFVMPELQKQNLIIQNINAGLDKNGKALKFQKRTAEILNYSFQLMARSIGQMWKNLIASLNPIRIMSNLVKKMIQMVKSGFQDFASYDVKWQRTMNVIKYNLRTIIRPAIQWIAQSLTNIIGFFDIILMKIQAAFGQTPISLFDQSAADAEKMREETEQTANVAAGFDELHDISGEMAGGGDAAIDLLGDIYKPQLSEDWIKLAEEIGDIFAGVIKGDMGFGEAMAKILGLAWEGIQKIWDWFKNTEFGKWLIDTFKKAFDVIWKAFLAWQLIKLGGKILYDALFSKINFAPVKTMFGKLFSSLGGWITGALSKSAFGSGIITGISALFNGMGLRDTLKLAFAGPEMVANFGGWGKMLGAIFAQSLIATAGLAIGIGGIMKGYDMNADSAAYNIGLDNAGGNQDDKKSYLGGTLTAGALGAVSGGIFGAALTGIGAGAMGGPIGMAVGALAGVLVASLAPAFEVVEVASRNANNEMQKIEYYQGMVQGASTSVNNFSELLNLSNDAIQAQTDKVYKLGEKYGVNKETLDGLVQSIKDGNYSSELSVGLNTELAGALEQLDWHYTNNSELTDKLTEAKKKLQKAEMDLAIAEDVAAGNFELAAARIEVAYASNIYTADEATKKITQIIKEGSAEQAQAILQDLSPDLQKNFDGYYTRTDKNLNELIDLYYNYNEKEREYFLESLTGEVQQEMRERINAIEREVKNAPWYQKMLDWNRDGKIWGVAYVPSAKGSVASSGSRSVNSMAVGTNYVPNDGLVYLHQGEAVIPKKYNRPYEPQGMSPEERAYMEQMMGTMRSLDSAMKQGITVKGQFVQRGSDLVAVVNRTKSQTGADLLSNVSYAR